MVFIKRDAAHRICALFESKTEPDLEELDSNHQDVIDFLTRCALDKQNSFLKSDLDLIRVLEDLIQILMAKNIISITDFPVPVIKKLVSRNKIRAQFQTVGHLFEEE